MESRPLVSLLKDGELKAVCGYYTVSSTRTVLNIWGLLWLPKVNLAANMVLEHHSLEHQCLRERDDAASP